MSVANQFMLRSAIGAPGSAVGVHIPRDGTKTITTILYSYRDPNFNQTTGFNAKTSEVVGRIVVADAGMFDVTQFGAGLPDATTDFTQAGYGPLILDLDTYGGSGEIVLPRPGKGVEGGLHNSGSGSGLIAILCRAWESPGAATHILFVPKLTIVMENVYDDYQTEPYMHNGRATRGRG